MAEFKKLYEQYLQEWKESKNESSFALYEHFLKRYNEALKEHYRRKYGYK